MTTARKNAAGAVWKVPGLDSGRQRWRQLQCN